ncbi:MAG: hypothetical protein HY983_04415 [Candidatus Magasanikbacteria bacterium]|nr:hypothetical protein [Candidatus Magasanikbacteria bacterium]
MYLIILQRLFGEALLDLVYFPVWWYSGGWKYAGSRCLVWLKAGNRTLAPGLWLQNLFVPMFGQTDWQGKIISFFMRGVQIVARTLALILWTIICAVVWLIWIFLPVIALYGLVRSLTPGV